MVSWAEFADAQPELAQRGEELLEATGLCMLGTLRKNGFPRISPLEPLIHDGQLYLGMMWQSRKALDLLRDPRCVVHNAHADKTGEDGDFKLYGRARDVRDEDEREAYCEALKAKIGWRPENDEFHLFAVDITEVGWFQIVGEEQQTQAWRP
jgi:nitroimidazol reductase NimA-like FMN-containing flavoprotein (pyridoxamine 5'-phosphate oxidase superfamily)